MDNFNFNLDTNRDEDFFGSLHKNRNRKILTQLFDEEFENIINSGDDENDQPRQKSVKHQKSESKVKTLSNQQQQQQQNNEIKITWTTVIAKVVTVYHQLPQEQQQSLCGDKVGLALLTNSSYDPKNVDHGYHNNDDAGHCKLILYKSKNQILESLSLHSDEKQLYKQKSGYLQFLNSKQEYWITLQFENEHDEKEFHEKLLSYDYKVYEENCNNAKDYNNIDTEFDCKIQKSKDDVSDAKPIGKQSLIKRVAKMGKPLPQLKAIASSSSPLSQDITTDSSDAEIVQTPPTNLNKPLIQPRPYKYSIPYQNHKQIMMNGKLETTSLPSASTSSSHAIPLIMSTSNIEAQYIPMLLTEQRTQNTELRWNVNKLEEKIEKVLDKLEKLEITANRHQNHIVDHYRRDQADIIIELEEKILQLKKENRHLNIALTNFKEQQHFPNDDVKEEQDRKIIKSLLNDFVKDYSKFLQEQNIHVNANMNLKVFLNEIIENYQELYGKYKLHQDIYEQETEQRITESNKHIEELKLNVMTLEDDNLCLKNQLQKFTEQLDENKRIEKELNNTLNSLREDNLQLNNQLKQQLTGELFHETISDKLQLATKLKAIMNDIYTDLNNKLQAQYPESQECQYLLNLTAASFKKHTLNALDSTSSSPP